jgi:hypothetical protein
LARDKTSPNTFGEENHDAPAYDEKIDDKLWNNLNPPGAIGLPNA